MRVINVIGIFHELMVNIIHPKDVLSAVRIGDTNFDNLMANAILALIAAKNDGSIAINKSSREENVKFI